MIILRSDFVTIFAVRADLIDIEHIESETLRVTMSKSFDFRKTSPCFNGCNIFALRGRAVLSKFAEDRRQLIFRERGSDFQQVVAERNPEDEGKLADYHDAYRVLTCCRWLLIHPGSTEAFRPRHPHK